MEKEQEEGFFLKKNRNSQYRSRILRFCEIEIENHKKRTD